MQAARPRRKARPSNEAVSRNEGEPHRMSSENTTTGEPSRSTDGEGCQDRAGQSRKDLGPKSLMSDQRAGGVSGGGGPRKVVRLSGETCDGGASSDAPTSGSSAAKPCEAGRAVAGVGDLHSSVDLADIKTAGERREGTCPTALQRGEGPTDGQSLVLWIGTKQRFGHLDGCYIGEKSRDETSRMGGWFSCFLLKTNRKNRDSVSRVRENRSHGLMRGRAAFSGYRRAAFPTLRATMKLTTITGRLFRALCSRHPAPGSCPGLI
jgi:hypothetical protein